LLRIREKDIIKIAGLDVAIYLRLIRFGKAVWLTGPDGLATHQLFAVLKL
jgi:hypothetical protein